MACRSFRKGRDGAKFLPRRGRWREAPEGVSATEPATDDIPNAGEETPQPASLTAAPVGSNERKRRPHRCGRGLKFAEVEEPLGFLALRGRAFGRARHGALGDPG